MTFGSRVTSAASSTRPVEVDRRRVAHRHAGAHVGLVEPDPQAPLGGGELGAVVDAVEPAVVLEGDRAHDPAVLAGERDEVGQVQLAGRPATASSDPIRRRSQAASKAYRPALISLRLELLGGGVLRLDDPLDRPELAADDPAELRRVGREDAREGDRRVVRRGAPRGSRRGRRRSRAARRRDRTRISVASAGHGRRAPRRTASPVPRGVVLERERRPARRTTVGDRLDRRRVDDDRRSAPVAPVGRARPGVEHVGEHRPAAQRVEDLGQRRAHPRAEAGRQHDGDGAARRRRVRGGHEGRRRRAGVGRRWSLPTRAGPGACGSAVIDRVAGIVWAPRSGCQPTRGRYATTSISTRAPFGSAATATVERAGGGSGHERARRSR